MPEGGVLHFLEIKDPIFLASLLGFLIQINTSEMRHRVRDSVVFYSVLHCTEMFLRLVSNLVSVNLLCEQIILTQVSLSYVVSALTPFKCSICAHQFGSCF